MQNQDFIPRKSDRYIPYYFVAFFILLAAADGFFVYLATSTHTGVVKEHAYEIGLQYDKIIAAKQQQDSLGWHVDIQLAANNILVVDISDKFVQPIVGAELTAYFVRPTMAGADFLVKLQADEQTAGRYSAVVEFPLKGLWDARINIVTERNSYQASRRLVIK